MEGFTTGLLMEEAAKTLHTVSNIKVNYTPRNEVVGGYTDFTMSIRPSVDKSYVVR